MLEGPRFLPDEEFDISKGCGWEDNVFLSPIQFWIDRACESHNLPWYNLIMLNQPSSHEKCGFKTSVTLLLYE